MCAYNLKGNHKFETDSVEPPLDAGRMLAAAALIILINAQLVIWQEIPSGLSLITAEHTLNRDNR
ncbi:hypothetical protein PGT21_004404 [Puccinia graminis f. sp. tritici]|uniref:Uncharacterized protein n=1 Tax=Puccinia graminis f. sp. tritici TaxID=56615 RepID=A0A5B0M399_PUCGR|nr:hypothetical protein PGT21_004404 [Puccinia graminis f. sp. tritici]KAA1090174.1 hypothetical protein PGTUg99_036817 [Puccinia graminis f. sp. tritici]